LPHYVLDARTATPHFPGIGRYVSNLARALVPLLASDERLTLLYDPAYPLAWHSERDERRHPERSEESGAVQAVPVAASPFALGQQWTVPGLLRRLRADLYHSAYILMSYRPGVPTVLTVYDLIPLILPGHSTLRARLLVRLATVLALRASQRVLAISEATRRDYLTHFRLSPERIVTIPLAADPIFRPQPAETIAVVRARYGLPDRYVLYLGSNKPHKNLVRLVEAWGNAECRMRNAECQLVIAGAWDERFPEPRRRVEELGLGERVRFLGPVAEVDLPALYSAAELFVFPSLYEGFGLPVLEAMACGTPVLCSNRSSLPEVAGDPSAGSGQAAAILADPLDVGGLAEAIGRVLAEPAALQAEMRAKGLVQAQRFTWQQVAAQTLAVYRALCY
jgi:alpha-1,3-rhamnosyl/mannosyltransferase